TLNVEREISVASKKFVSIPLCFIDGFPSPLSQSLQGAVKKHARLSYYMVRNRSVLFLGA
ncbi:MAG: hypothetical protein ACREU0_10495, partial [Burkholderiales bacterium]